ncbi:superoxide dismutase family protein [Erythrobacter mangrovi]|uniref:Superoxide dismutase family protein n=1 Tax=Erythrobacter mangrovi TaxID=2739433 RepID=A0A7D4BNH9_9SPHN|nr:superoxide dismutase family protein [Erythrobacter mangrovi]QKG71044.1 superoxide dismutase family protein [Erythrobacter mangrovi]
MRAQLALVPFIALLAGACTTVDALPDTRVGEAALRTSDGLPTGNVHLVQTGSTLSLVVAVVGIPAGEHGFHLHTTGSCTAPDFGSAGGHLNPDGRHHGSLAEGGKHLGDLPNLVVASNRTGSLVADLTGDASTLLPRIFDADGTAVVIHAGPDDYRSDPSGNAGARIACGVLNPSS